MAGLGVLWLSLALAQAVLPEPATGGKGGGPIDMLLLRGHAEMNFGAQPPLDERYQKQLRDRGYRITVASEQDVLSSGYLKQFSLVIYLNPGPMFGGGYFDSAVWRGGPALLTVRENEGVLRRYVEEGGGLLMVPALEEIGTRTVESLRILFAPYGLDTACAVPRDQDRLWEAARVMKKIPIYYGWSDFFAVHPVTEGVRRIYYPSYCTRWDDNYTTIPLFPKDPAWLRLIDTSPTTRCICRRGTLYDPAAPEIPLAGLDHPAIAVARDFGRGRVAVCGIGAFHLFYLTYSEHGVFAEANFVRIDGIAMDKGDGTTPSDLNKFLDNLYRWLSEPAARLGLGGGVAGGVQVSPNPYATAGDAALADRPAQDDPMIRGPIRPQRILVGAHSAMSDGRGSPADWARAAKEAGYDVVCFTEAFESLKRGEWDVFVKACEDASGPGVALLPGVDFDTDLGNRFLVVGHTSPFRDHLLTDDGRRLMWTGHLLIGMGDVQAIAARPARLATIREKGKLSPELYSHLASVAVATYDRKGRLVDDGLFAYKALVDNGTHPYPVAVHEVFKPGDLKRAAASGLQNYVNSDAADHAAFFFRQSHARSGGNPDRAYVSSGPLVDRFGIDNWQLPTWQMRLQAHGLEPITSISVWDQRGLFRRFCPSTNHVELAWHGDLAAQQWFTTVVEDAAGGRAILPAVRTLTPYHVIRCLDRQNFFGVGLPLMEVSYTGRERSATKGPLQVEVPGVRLAAPLCPKYRFPLFSADFIIHENLYDSTLVPGGRVPGADNDPLFNEMPIPEYRAVRRFTSFTSPRKVVNGRLHELDLTTLSSLAVTGTVWPVVMKVKPKSQVHMMGPNGDMSATKLPATGFLDLPPGTVVGDAVLATPLRVTAGGQVGYPSVEGLLVPSGSVYHAEAFSIPGKSGLGTNLAGVVAALGFGPRATMPVTLTQGRIDRHMVWLDLTATEGGVAGRVDATTPAVLGRMPLRIKGINGRWPIGLWRPGAALALGTVFEEAVRLPLDVTVPGEFYAGNLLRCDHEEAYLAFATEWRADADTAIEVINPTGKPIHVSIQSPRNIADRPAINLTVDVPAGGMLVRVVPAVKSVVPGEVPR